MQKLMDLSRWFLLAPGSKLDFNSERPRSVSVDINAAHRTRIDMIDPDGVVQFLAIVEGRDRLEFQTTGAFSLAVDQPETFIYSEDSDTVHLVVDAPESYTKIMQGRRTRNPELEYIADRMNRNFQRQLERQERVYGDLLARTIEARAPQPAPTGAAPVIGGEPKPDGDGDAPADQAAGAGDGNKGKA